MTDYSALWALPLAFAFTALYLWLIWLFDRKDRGLLLTVGMVVAMGVVTEALMGLTFLLN